MATKVDLLETVEIFQDLTHGEMEGIGQHTIMKRFKAGHLFYMPSDPGEVLFTLKQGRVQLYRLAPNGRKLIVAVLNPGAVFGQMALVGQRLHQTFAQALDDCIICVMGRLEVEHMLIHKPQVALRLLDSLGRRLDESERRLEDITFKRIPARLAGLLVQLHAEWGEDGVLKGYTHQSLADMLGTYRETTTQVLNEFQNRNLIRLGRKAIEIMDVSGLEMLAAET
jgi:CRP-like cAMP-binding protein